MGTLGEKIDKILATDDPIQLLEWDRNFGFHPHENIPAVITKAQGITLTDSMGNNYLDFLAGTTCVNVGYGNREVIDTIKKQLEATAGLIGLAVNPSSAKLMRLLAEIAPKGLSRSFMISGGSEANEMALKIARRCTKKFKIIARWSGYHGNTAAALSASGVLNYKMDFDPVLPGFIHVPPPYCYRCDFGLEYPECDLMCARIIDHTIHYEDSKQVAAVIAEPIIGWGGVVIPPKEYFPMIREICDKYDVLLILDEVLTGFGRTGKMFACEHWNIVPDIMTLAKGISSIYVPCSAVLVQEKLAESLGVAPELSPEYSERGIMGITGMNHPLPSAAALASIKVIIEKDLSKNAEKVGEYLLSGLREIAEEHSIFGEVRGKGLLIGLEVVKDKESKEPDIDLGKELQVKSILNGLIIGHSAMRTRNSSILLFTPPLIVTREEVDKALEIFQNTISQSS